MSMKPIQARVCECYDSSKYHLRDGTSVVSLCGRMVANGTYIPLAAWGLLDSAWCSNCERKHENEIRRRAREASGH